MILLLNSYLLVIQKFKFDIAQLLMIDKDLT